MIRETDVVLCELASLPVNTTNCTNHSRGPMQLSSWQAIEERTRRTGEEKYIEV